MSSHGSADSQEILILEVLDEQTQALLAVLVDMSEDDVRAPSLLPGWSRAHVLAHLDGNARGLGRLARSATDEVPRAMYQTMDARNADIDLRATRSVDEHRNAVAHSAAELRRDIGSIRLGDLRVTLGTGAQIPARDIALLRLQEIAAHLSDLGWQGYTWREWPDAFVQWRLGKIVASARDREDFPVAWLDIDGKRVGILEQGSAGITGSSHELLAWMMGRSDGAGLVAEGLATEGLPPAPDWWR